MNRLVCGSFIVIITWIKRWVRTGLLTLAITFFATSFLIFPIFPISEGNMLQNWVIPSADANPFIDILERIGLYNPPRRGVAPAGRQSGGAGRGPICILPDSAQGNDSLKALIPFQSMNGTMDNQDNQEIETDPDTELVGGLTVLEHPTFWFYIPYTADPETPKKQLRIAQFVLLDEGYHPVFNELISAELRDTPGLIEYLLPYGLEPDELYRWYFSVICDIDKLSRNPVVRGWVERIELTSDLQTALDNASIFDQYLVYAENEIGFETVNSLVSIRRQFSDFINVKREEWNRLLAYFDIVGANQFDLLQPMKLIERKVVDSIQLPANM